MLLRIAALLPGLIAASGCSSDVPRAAPLTTDAVYQNETVGVRMAIPDGWYMTARTEPPSGALPKPIVLVSYSQSKVEKPGQFELILAEVPAGEDAGKFLLERKLGPVKWKPDVQSKPAVVGGRPVTHHQVDSLGAAPVRRDLYSIRLGGRVLYFVATIVPDRREQAMQILDSVVWTK
ncbi:MAG: hypothetical protein U0791_08115 [Gemmataceae bacterium]